MKDLLKKFIMMQMLLYLIILSCSESNPRTQIDTELDDVETIESIPSRDSLVWIEPEPSCHICFYTADAWDDDEASKLMVLDSNGENLRELTCVNSAQFSWINEVTWKPDGSAIAVLAGRGGSTNIFIIDVQLNEYNRLTMDDYAKRDITWSPNGQYIAYTQTDVSDIFSNEHEIAIIDTYTEDKTQLTHTGGRASDPIWTDDSQTVLYSGQNYEIAAIDVDGSSTDYTQDQAQLLYRSRNNRNPEFNFNALADHWDSMGEIEVETPYWEHKRTFLTFRPVFFSPAINTPVNSGVIAKTEIGGAYYFSLIDPETYECKILEPESTGYPYQSSANPIFWVSDHEFLFFGNRNGPEGFAILDITSGQTRWLVNNENAAYDFKCWAGVSILDSPRNLLTIDEICEQGIVVPLTADEAGILVLLGDPLSREAIAAEPLYDIEPDFCDSVITYVYEGISIEFWKYCNSSPNSTSVFLVEVNSNEYLNEYEIGIGFSPNQVHELFGVNHGALQFLYDGFLFREYSYSRTENGNPVVSFMFEDEGLIRMQWRSDFI